MLSIGTLTERVADMSEGREIKKMKIKTFPLFVVVMKTLEGDTKFYAGSKSWLHWTVDVSRAKFFHTKGHAHRAILYHGFKSAVIGRIIVEGELYVDPVGES